MATSTTAAAKILDEEARPVTKPTMSLDQHIQSLPQELQDEIKEKLIASPARIDINHYKPPIGLQLDHKTRERFAKTFYKAHFVCNVEDVSDLLEFECCIMLNDWLSSISAAHRLLIEKIEVVVVEVVGADRASRLRGFRTGQVGPKSFLEEEHSYLQNQAWEHGPERLVREVVFAMRLTVMQADGTAKEVCCP